ncbi:RIP metalloprotease RseP [uncultured Flavobacterium sp.]|uniref:RIP metalloprotease RseP n=1 Tax=uncultured Flavobacterium sp. TaxID=165435 RepID=UPI0030EDAD28|tara:strand:- start:116 stop:1438 length:1323 start_codon:yes stop_codon:yes gene_type:complete
MIQVAQILFILSVLVILHEFGHYLAAKIFKVRVEKFYLFMDAGFSLVKKKIGETEWGIGWLPIGGYVKLSGMIDESMDVEQMNSEPEEWEFRAKPAWQRLIIMLGGIIVNILLAWFIYLIMFSTVGQKYVSTEVIQKNGLSFGEVGKSVGFKDGDRILSVDGKLQPKFNWMIIDVLLSDKIEIERDGKKMELDLTEEQKGEIISKEGKSFAGPRLINAIVDSLTSANTINSGFKKEDLIVGVNGVKIPFYDKLTLELEKNKNDSITIDILRNGNPLSIKTLVDKDGKIGFRPTFKEIKDYQIINKLSIGDAAPAAAKEAWQLLVYNVKQFKLILSPKTEAYKQVKSPVGIARILPDEWNWEFIWNFTALFSIGLAFINLLPIPGLDGGHALFTIVEMITGKTLSVKAAERVQTFGMIILLTLMALTFGKDIYQLVVDKLF